MGGTFDFILINSLTQAATFDQSHSVVVGSRRDGLRSPGGCGVGGGGFLISEITDLALNENHRYNTAGGGGVNKGVRG